MHLNWKWFCYVHTELLIVLEVFIYHIHFLYSISMNLQKHLQNIKHTSFFLRSSSFLFFSSLICAKRCFFLSSSAFSSLLSDMMPQLYTKKYFLFFLHIPLRVQWKMLYFWKNKALVSKKVSTCFLSDYTVYWRIKFFKTSL